MKNLFCSRLLIVCVCSSFCRDVPDKMAASPVFGSVRSAESIAGTKCRHPTIASLILERMPLAAPVNFRFSAGGAAQAVNANTNVKVNFNVQSFLNNATFSNATFTVPASGIYNFSVYLFVFGNNAGSMSVSIAVKGVNKAGTSFNIVKSVFQAIGFSDNVSLNTGDLVTVQVNANAVMAIAAVQGTYFTGFKIN